MSIEFKIAYPLRHPGPDDSWRRLHRLADAAEPQVRRAFLEAIERIRGKLDEQAIESALRRGDLASVIRLIPLHDLDDALAEAEAHLDTVRSSAFVIARDAALPMLHTEQLAIHLGTRQLTLSLGFQHASEAVLDAIRRNAGERVTGVTALTRQAITQLVERMYAAGKSPQTIVREIRATIGLTPRLEQAVSNYRAALEAEGVKPSRVELLVGRRRMKLLKYRATMIARTESMQAMNDGQRSSWQTLAARGLLDDNAWEVEWLAIVPSDGRTCTVCESLDGMRRPIDGDYEDEAAKGGPSQHPDCRCVERLVAKKREQD